MTDAPTALPVDPVAPEREPEQQPDPPPRSSEPRLVGELVAEFMTDLEQRTRERR